MNLHIQLKRCAGFCGDAFDDAVLCFEDVVYAIVHSAYKINPFCVVYALCSDYMKLISTGRQAAETYAYYEDSISAAST